MFLILSLGLLPLGLIAVLASLKTVRDNRGDRNKEVRAQVMVTAQRLNTALSNGILVVQAASAATNGRLPRHSDCQRVVVQLSTSQLIQGRHALYGADGKLRCATPGYAAPAVITPDAHGSRSKMTLSDQGLRLAVANEHGLIEGIVDYPASTLSKLTTLSTQGRAFVLILLQGDRQLVLHNDSNDRPSTRNLVHQVPIAGGQLQLRIAAAAPAISAPELLTILLPVMMWITAATIGWLIVDGLLLRPLARMQRVVSGYRPGDRSLALPTISSPAKEIGELGEAFDQVTRTVARHEADLEAAVERQTRLVREVHHRVKNNLQVVASLLNLHSRGSRSEEVAAAYASIQRRVDALAVVHRNHYAELEENRGVALKSLISELCANLRATAPAAASHMTISLNVEPFYVTQDVAVSVAFLITEVVEFAIFCEAQSVRIALSGADDAARLAIESDSLRGESKCDPELSARFDRIVTGLSRQLRSTLDRDTDTGIYALPITVIAKGLR